MELLVIKNEFSVCKVADLSLVQLDSAFCFLGKTDEEISLVCETAHVPANVTAQEDGWRAFRIQGVLDFSLIGILSKIAAILAAEKIGIYVVSTYNTDYVFVKEASFRAALAALEVQGYKIIAP